MRRRLQSAAERSARSRKKNDPSMFANQKKVTLLYVCCFFSVQVDFAFKHERRR